MALLAPNKSSNCKSRAPLYEFTKALISDRCCSALNHLQQKRMPVKSWLGKEMCLSLLFLAMGHFKRRLELIF